MEMDTVVQIGRELFYTSLLLTAPTIAVSLLVGLAISIFQTVTSIQEQTLSFAPRIFAVGLVLAFSLPWSLHVLMNFAQNMFYYAAEAGR